MDIMIPDSRPEKRQADVGPEKEGEISLKYTPEIVRLNAI
jgi:hypothetical protein